MTAASTLLLGIHSVAAGLAASRGQVRRLLLQSDSSNPRLRELRASAKQQGVAVEEVSREDLDKLAEGHRHQGVAAWFEPANLLAENDLPKLLMDGGQSPLFLILDGVQDPHNLGACLRSADAAGVAAVIMPKNRAAPITPVVRRAAAGAAEHIPIVQVTNLARTMRLLKQKGIWIAGTSDQARQSIYEADLQGPMALVMGSEGQGMRHLTAELCDFLFALPMCGEVESLNVSVATGICLYEALRQRQN